MAQVTMASMYATGKGAPKDLSIARQWALKAAEQGDTKGQYLIGRMYLIGEGGSKEVEKGKYWLKKAEDQGNTQAGQLLWLFYRGKLDEYL